MSADRVLMIQLTDGRDLAFHDGGDRSGYPVFGLHGTPGCRLSRWPDDDIYRAAGVRFITTDRAGYGQSARNRGRSVAHEAADIGALADALGIETFSVIGGSGGGPHALACAALLHGCVDRVVSHSGLAPLGSEGLSESDWLRGMSDECVDELRWAQSGEETLVRELIIQQRTMEEDLAGDLSQFLGDSAPAVDQDFLQRPEVVEAFRRIVPEQAAHGVSGAVDDHLAFTRPWGFSVTSIDIPVLVTYGMHDVFVPPAHGEWLCSQLQQAEARIEETGGHMPSDPRAEISSTMAWIKPG